ncbi:OmpA family protein [Pseudooceanicola sp.]|uniref:OmpA family protein n=1 Tax=Pseudooceanicola sp. TaxID=1914328 RepID=UPI0026158CE2|nr:OmpA family protein [Pseudooceanicola sp.]MDF1856259.1 OmpA family protein [Pseudooceanicola sp.]
MRLLVGSTLVTAVLLPQPAAAQAIDLALPTTARSTAEIVTAPDTFALPIGPFAEGRLPVLEVNGQVSRLAWQIPGQRMTTQQLLAPLKAQFASAGFDPLFECVDRACGGFDFRYALDVLAAPAMYVDLFDYRVFSARRDGADGVDHVMILASRAGALGYVQIVLITPEGSPGLNPPRADASSGQPAPDPDRSPADAAAPLAEQLERNGHAALADLEFVTGSAELSDHAYDSLQSLAAYLIAHPDRRVALVGHTDTKGSLEGNIALSRRRAQSVLDRLVDRYGVARGQLDAEGMGYLAPIASNLTAEGRDRNRRVEAVLLTSD